MKTKRPLTENDRIKKVIFNLNAEINLGRFEIKKLRRAKASCHQLYRLAYDRAIYHILREVNELSEIRDRHKQSLKLLKGENYEK